MRRNKAKETKTCPILDGKCLKTGCEIYNERLDRCEIATLTECPARRESELRVVKGCHEHLDRLRPAYSAERVGSLPP